MVSYDVILMVMLQMVCVFVEEMVMVLMMVV